MYQASGAKRGALSLESLAMIIVVLVVLAIVVIFFRGGMGDIGKKIGSTSREVTSPVSNVTSEMGKAPWEVSGLVQILGCRKRPMLLKRRQPLQTMRKQGLVRPSNCNGACQGAEGLG